MKVLFFGRLADKAGRELDVALPEGGCTVAELRDRICHDRPDLATDFAHSSARACIHQRVAGESERVLPEHEFAFIPPLSGG